MISDVDTEKISREPGAVSPKVLPKEVPTEAIVSHVSLSIPGYKEERINIPVPHSLSNPQGVSRETAAHISGTYRAAHGVPDEHREERLQKQLHHRIERLSGQVKFNLQLMADRQEPRDQTIVLWKQSGDPRQDFIDQTVCFLLQDSAFQFGDPLLISKAGKNGEVVEKEYFLSTHLKSLEFPGILAFVEEATIKFTKGGKTESMLARTLSLQFFPPEEWEEIKAAAVRE